MNLDFSEFNRVESTGDEFSGSVICSYETTGDVHTFAKNFFSKSDKLAVVHKIIVTDQKLIYLSVVKDEVSQYESVDLVNSNEIFFTIKQFIDRVPDKSMLAMFNFLAFKFSRLS